MMGTCPLSPDLTRMYPAMLEEVTIVFRGSAAGPPEMPPLQLENFISAPSLLLPLRLLVTAPSPLKGVKADDGRCLYIVLKAIVHPHSCLLFRR